MKHSIFAGTLALLLIKHVCSFAAIPPEAIVQQTYTHKYGGNVSKGEWDSRGSTGQVVSVQASGVTITQNYYKGVLQGKTTYSFPKTDITQKTEVYEDGKIVSIIYHYPSGLHSQEMVPLSTSLTQVTSWYENSVPKSIEEMEGQLIANAVYYHPHHEEESRVVQGYGVRTSRDSKGVLLSRDTIQNGIMVLKTTYHPSGEILSTSPHDNGIVHGTHKVFDTAGQPTEIQLWENGKRHGVTTILENGVVTAEIPYYKGQKHGVEKHYIAPSTVAVEISWLNGLRNGATRKYTPDGTQVQWFLLGQPVSAPKQVAPAGTYLPLPPSKARNTSKPSR